MIVRRFKKIKTLFKIIKYLIFTILYIALLTVMPITILYLVYLIVEYIVSGKLNKTYDKYRIKFLKARKNLYCVVNNIIFKFKK